jgi:UDP-3-O-acyl-N-acetylglucosamine deacetylase
MVKLRLAHLYGVGEDATYSQPVTVDLRDMFVGLDPITSREMTLTANLPIDELQRLQWKTSSKNAKHEVSPARTDNHGFPNKTEQRILHLSS